jgi:DNA-binding winged helix-turn-helix (wHTH) protein
VTTTHILGPFRLDGEAQLLLRGAEPVALGKRAVAVLCALVERPGLPVSKEALIDAAWEGLAVDENNLVVQVAALRRVFGEETGGGDGWIETLPRRGYRFASASHLRAGAIA